MYICIYIYHRTLDCCTLRTAFLNDLGGDTERERTNFRVQVDAELLRVLEAVLLRVLDGVFDAVLLREFAVKGLVFVFVFVVVDACVLNSVR